MPKRVTKRPLKYSDVEELAHYTRGNVTHVRVKFEDGKEDIITDLDNLMTPDDEPILRWASLHAGMEVVALWEPTGCHYDAEVVSVFIKETQGPVYQQPEDKVPATKHAKKEPRKTKKAIRTTDRSGKDAAAAAKVKASEIREQKKQQQMAKILSQQQLAEKMFSCMLPISEEDDSRHDVLPSSQESHQLPFQQYTLPSKQIATQQPPQQIQADQQIPTQQPPQQIPTQQPPQQIPTQQPPQQIPTQQPPQQIPTQQSHQQIPTQQPPHQIPTQQPPQQIPTQQPPQQIPTLQPPQQIPTQQPPQQIPTQQSHQQIPTQQPPQQIPTQRPPQQIQAHQQIPTQQPPQQIPTQQSHQQIPTQQPPHQIPTQQPPQQIPTQQPPQQIPTLQPPQQIPTQQPPQQIPTQQSHKQIPTQQPPQQIPTQRPPQQIQAHQQIPTQQPPQQIPTQQSHQQIPTQQPPQQIPTQQPSQQSQAHQQIPTWEIQARLPQQIATQQFSRQLPQTPYFQNTHQSPQHKITAGPSQRKIQPQPQITHVSQSPQTPGRASPSTYVDYALHCPSTPEPFFSYTQALMDAEQNCNGCNRKDEKIRSLQNRISSLEQQLKEAQSSIHFAEEEEDQEHYMPKTGLAIPKAKYLLLRNLDSVPAEYSLLVQGAPLAVASRWLAEVMPRIQHLSEKNKLKKLMDGLHSLKEMAISGGTRHFKGASKAILDALRVYGVNVLRMRSADVTRAFNEKLTSARRAAANLHQ